MEIIEIEALVSIALFGFRHTSPLVPRSGGGRAHAAQAGAGPIRSPDGAQA